MSHSDASLEFTQYSNSLITFIRMMITHLATLIFHACLLFFVSVLDVDWAHFIG